MRGASLAAIGGYSGIGKTALINGVRPAATDAGALFVTGKFDQFQRGVPYASLIQALEGFARRLLTQDDDTQAEWRARITAATSPNAALLVDVLPDLGHLLGEQPPVPDLPPSEAEQRFNLLFGRFIRALGQAGAPLVLFLDDLQWADVPSLRVLEQLITDEDAAHVLLLGAYRDNEVDAGHVLDSMLSRLRERGQRSTN